MTAALGLLLAGPGAVFAILSIYLLTLALASIRATTEGQLGVRTATKRLVVLVPAHDEQELVGRCVSSLLAQAYSARLYRVVVIADNCTDATVSVAIAAGADVMVRNEPRARGKGRALRWAMDSLLAAPEAPDAIVVVDADSVADPNMLSALAFELDAGYPVVQADYSLLLDEQSTPRTRLVAAAFMLFHRVRFGGRARLGMSANLVGNGMLFSSAILREHPWAAFTGVEDLEHSIDLRLSGVTIRFAPVAHIAGPAAASRAGEVRQRIRWEGGRLHVVRTRLPQLITEGLRRHDWRLVDAALDLATPPLGLLAIATGVGTVVVALAVVVGFVPRWSLASWLIAVVAIALFVVTGLLSARAPRKIWEAIAVTPIYLGWKMLTYLRLSRSFDPNRWERSDRTAPDSGRATIAGVPIDLVDLSMGVERVRSALGAGRLFQVATVNLDFLVRAQRDPNVMRILRQTALNIADGAPVVWLAWLLGHRAPGRVAGADLVPALFSKLSETGGRVFLLGGEQGVAAAAGERLQLLYPGLEVAGTYEPPRASIADMDNGEILSRIADSKADVLLVAFGHPKQEEWIDRHRDQLSVSVAIGVGCVLDLIAGRTRRAPRWMQAVGMEWIYRILQEPRRLAVRYATDAAWLLPVTVSVLQARLLGAAAEASLTEPA